MVSWTGTTVLFKDQQSLEDQLDVVRVLRRWKLEMVERDRMVSKSSKLGKISAE